VPPEDLHHRRSVIVHALEQLPVVLRPPAAGSASA
jgi:vitamin D3 1,25-hydroxylase